MIQANIIEVMFEALRSDRGLIIRCDPEIRTLLRQKLYEVRRENEELEVLKLEAPNTEPDLIYITKRT